MKNAGVILEVFVDSRREERRTRPEQNGLRHIAFRVDGFEKTIMIFDCESIRTDFFGKRFTFTKNPDGVNGRIKPAEFGS